MLPGEVTVGEDEETTKLGVWDVGKKRKSAHVSLSRRRAWERKGEREISALSLATGH